MSTPLPGKAMVLAAGLGKRLRPYTDETPKPLLPIGGKKLIDWSLDQLTGAGVNDVTINSFYRSQKLRDHLNTRALPKINFIVEEELSGTGGATRNALPHLGPAPFFLLFSNVIWDNQKTQALQRLSAHWNNDTMDVLALVLDRAELNWLKGKGDYVLQDADYRLKRAASGHDAPIVGTGLYLVHPRAFAKMSDGAFPITTVLDEASRNGRFHGLLHNGEWYYVNTVQDYMTINRILTG